MSKKIVIRPSEFSLKTPVSGVRKGTGKVVPMCGDDLYVLAVIIYYCVRLVLTRLRPLRVVGMFSAFCDNSLIKTAPG